jgi:hypothetical protein
LLAVYHVHEAGVNDVAFAPDGRRLFSVGDTIRVWRVPRETRTPAEVKALAARASQ